MNGNKENKDREIFTCDPDFIRPLYDSRAHIRCRKCQVDIQSNRSVELWYFIANFQTRSIGEATAVDKFRASYGNARAQNCNKNRKNIKRKCQDIF